MHTHVGADLLVVLLWDESLGACTAISGVVLFEARTMHGTMNIDAAFWCL